MVKPDSDAPSLDAIRARLDALDAQVLALIDERAGIARQVAVAKAAAGDGGKFGLRPGREAQLLRSLLARPRNAATPTLITRLWRELIGDSLSRQGPFHIAVFGGKAPARAVEFARARFGAAPGMVSVDRAEDAIAAARTPGGVAVLSLATEAPWWGRLLAEPRMKVFAALPCLNDWGGLTALAAAEIEVEPTGNDLTYWVTDSAMTASAIQDALSRDGVAADLIAEAGGLKLFALIGYYQPQDERLARAPGRLTGVIGAAPAPLDAPGF